MHFYCSSSNFRAFDRSRASASRHIEHSAAPEQAPAALFKHAAYLGQARAALVENSAAAAQARAAISSILRLRDTGPAVRKDAGLLSKYKFLTPKIRIDVFTKLDAMAPK